jgi:hypothetical protein
MTMLAWFRIRRITFTCNHCGAVQRIPLRRVHAFERFHGIVEGQAVLIRCPQCIRGLQIPVPYTTHTGHSVEIDPTNPSSEALIHEAVC